MTCERCGRDAPLVACRTNRGITRACRACALRGVRQAADRIFRRKRTQEGGYWRHLRGNDNPYAMGFAGELAFALRYGTELDLRVLDAPLGDGGRDCTVNGRTVDVKASTYDNLFMPAHHALRADFYVHAKMDEATLDGHLTGWATRADMEAAPIRRDLQAPARVIMAEHLRAMPLLDLELMVEPLSLAEGDMRWDSDWYR